MGPEVACGPGVERYYKIVGEVGQVNGDVERILAAVQHHHRRGVVVQRLLENAEVASTL